MTERDDQRLGQRFEELRAESRGPGAAPDFASMMAEAKRQAAEAPALEVAAGSSGSTDADPRRAGIRSHGRWARLAGWASVAAAAAVAGLMVMDRAPSADQEFERLVAAYSAEPGGAAWRSPTSGLLNVPGIDLTRSVPSIGGPVRGLDPSDRPAPQTSPEEDNS